MSTYDPKITIKKGGTQLINIVSSTAFSGLLVILLKEIFDKEFDIQNIQEGIDTISGTVIFLTPFVSAAVRMIANYIKKSKKGGL